MLSDIAAIAAVATLVAAIIARCHTRTRALSQDDAMERIIIDPWYCRPCGLFALLVGGVLSVIAVELSAFHKLSQLPPISSNVSLLQQLEEAHAEILTFDAPLTDNPWWRDLSALQRQVWHDCGWFRRAALTTRLGALERLINDKAVRAPTLYIGSHKLPSSAKMHALLYHGAYFRTPDGLDGRTTHAGFPKCSDAFKTCTNQHDMLIRPLLAAGASVYVFLHTFRSGSTQRDATLVRLFRPTEYAIEAHTKEHKIVYSYLRCLQLLRQSKVRADFVYVLRFDVLYRVPVLSLRLDWERINIAWRSEANAWLSERTTSDLFHAFAGRYLNAYADALVWSGNFKGGCCHGAAHWIYTPLANDTRVGASNIAFIEDGLFQSRQDVLNASHRPENDLFILILRSCPNPTDLAPSTCWTSQSSELQVSRTPSVKRLQPPEFDRAHVRVPTAPTPRRHGQTARPRGASVGYGT